MGRAGRRFALAFVVALGGAALALGLTGPDEGAGEPRMRHERDAVAREASCERPDGVAAQACGRCHAEAYEQWRQDPHSIAWTDPVFQAEYSSAPSQFCADCHADAEARLGHPPEDGVDCSSCHPPDSTLEQSLERGEPPLPQGVVVCARCHQFDFPSPEHGVLGNYDPADPLQDTIQEWQGSRSGRRGETCIECHMPEARSGGPRSHRMRSIDDPRFLASSLLVDVDATRVDGGVAVEVEMRGGRVGHRVPTGDMFRRLRVEVETDDGVVQRKWLGRRFAQMPNSTDTGFALRPVLDERVAAPGTRTEDAQTVLRFELPAADASVVRWSVDLFRLPLHVAEERGLDAEVIEYPVRHGSERL